MHQTKSGIIIPGPVERKPQAVRRHKTGLHLYQGIGAVIDPDGSVAWQDPDWVDNILADEGELDMLDVYLRAQANPSKFLALINGGTTPPVETSTMAYLAGAAGAGETQAPAAGGYNRQQVLTTDWTVPALVGGDHQSSAAEKTFGAATVAWTISHTALVTAATGQTAGSGRFLAYLALSATTTIAINQSFKYVLRWTQT